MDSGLSLRQRRSASSGQPDSGHRDGGRCWALRAHGAPARSAAGDMQGATPFP